MFVFNGRVAALWCSFKQPGRVARPRGARAQAPLPMPPRFLHPMGFVSLPRSALRSLLLQPASLPCLQGIAQAFPAYPLSGHPAGIRRSRKAFGVMIGTRKVDIRGEQVAVASYQSVGLGPLPPIVGRVDQTGRDKVGLREDSPRQPSRTKANSRPAASCARRWSG